MELNTNVEKIKRFNRFYLRIIGLFSFYTDESPYSVTEALILFEINNKRDCTASYLAEYFFFDKGYMSRILNKFERLELIKRIPSEQDRRIKHLEMTPKGGEVLKGLANKASLDVARMIESINSKDIDNLIQSMETIEKILEQKSRTG